jgi:hypothetical protein
MKRLIPILLTVVVFFTAFTMLNKPAIHNAKWMLGRWENVSTDGTLIEAWQKQNDTTYTGYSHFIIGKDTVFSEQIRMEQHGKELFYMPSVKDQNGGKPIIFRASLHNKKQLIFENPLHDFPQKISYSHPTKDSLVAEISGTEKGKFKSQKFFMIRSK